MNSFQERHRFRYFLRDSVRAADDRSLHHHQMRHQFCRRPFVCLRLYLPLRCWHGVCCPQESPLGATQRFKNGNEGPHAPTLSGTPVLHFPTGWEVIGVRASVQIAIGRLMLSRRQPVQRHAPIAERVLPRMPARKFAAPPAAGLLFGRRGRRSRESPPAIP